MKHRGFRVLALLLVLMLLFSMMPLSIFAAENDPPEETIAAEETELDPTEPDATDAEEPEAPQSTEEPTEAPTEADEPMQPEQATAVLQPSAADALQPDEPEQPETAATNGYIGTDGKVKLYSFCDSNVTLYDRSPVTPFPYITTCHLNMNPSETEFTSNSTYGQLFYCIDFDAHIGNAGTSSNNPGTDLLKTKKWTGLSDFAQEGITFALLCGAPNCDA